MQAEGLVRRLDAFTRFLEVAAQANGGLLNYATIARDVGVSAKTVHEYYSILVDTLLGFMLPAFAKSHKRRVNQAAKFYWFDCGVPQTILGRKLSAKTPEFGQAFEHFLLLEARAAMLYDRTFSTMSYWRTTNGLEVDLILEDHTAVKMQRLWIVSQEERPRRLEGGVEVLPWQVFLRRLRHGLNQVD